MQGKKVTKKVTEFTYFSFLVKDTRQTDRKIQTQTDKKDTVILTSKILDRLNYAKESVFLILIKCKETQRYELLLVELASYFVAGMSKKVEIDNEILECCRNIDTLDTDRQR